MKDLTGMGGGFDPRSAFRCQKDEKLRADITKAATEIIEEQLKIGLDVITDGEVERGGNRNRNNPRCRLSRWKTRLEESHR